MHLYVFQGKKHVSFFEKVKVFTKYVKREKKPKKTKLLFEKKMDNEVGHIFIKFY